jgi:hypothetical protein
MKVRTLLFYFSLMLLIACGPDNAADRFKQQVPAEEEEKLADLNIKRLEQDLFKATPDNVNSQIDSLRKKYGEFFDLYLIAIAKISLPDDPLLDQKILYYTGDGDIKKIHEDINKQYGDLTDLKEKLRRGFTRYKHFFPNKSIPTIVTFLSGFKLAYATTEKELGIGLDMYLGRNYGYYNNLEFPAYKTISCTKDYIATDAMFNWCVTEFTDSSTTVLGCMLHQGKMLYLLDAIYPETPDSIKLRYSSNQYQWCHQNEATVWATMVDQEALYSTNGKEINKYCDEHPFTPGYPRESPGRLGNWIGWQIVRAYMAKHTDLSLEDLFKLKDPQKFLSESGYRPAKAN